MIYSLHIVHVLSSRVMCNLVLSLPDLPQIQVKTESSKSISEFFSKKVARATEEPKLKKSPVKEESTGAGETKNVKQEPESGTTLENTGLKDELVENYEQNSVKEEPESQSSLEGATRLKDEAAKDSQQNIVEEEPEYHNDYHKLISTKDECVDTCDISCMSPLVSRSITEKRDYEESGSHSKPFAKEIERESPVRKRSKGADDKQKTLFSYFGRS